MAIIVEYLEAEAVGHAGDVVAYRSLEAVLRDEALEVARYKLRILA